MSPPPHPPSEFPARKRFSGRPFLTGLIAIPGSKGPLPPANRGGITPDTVTPASFSMGSVQRWPYGSVVRALGQGRMGPGPEGGGEGRGGSHPAGRTAQHPTARREGLGPCQSSEPCHSPGKLPPPPLVEREPLLPGKKKSDPPWGRGWVLWFLDSSPSVSYPTLKPAHPFAGPACVIMVNGNSASGRPFQRTSGFRPLFVLFTLLLASESRTDTAT